MHVCDCVNTIRRHKTRSTR